MNRYFTDIRVGCAAIRDREHTSYDESYPGLHHDTPDVVEYIHGVNTSDGWLVKENDILYLNKLCEKLNLETKSLIRDIKLSIVESKYKAISAYKIPDKPNWWLDCPNCNLTPLIWEFNNGRSTACGCGINEYNNFSICSESIVSWVNRHGGSALDYDSDKLRKNWNHWVITSEELEKHSYLRSLDRW